MARSVADAARLLSALAGPDPADPATAAAAGRPGDYTAFLDPGALAGARLGVWRDGLRGAGRSTVAVLDAAVAALGAAGAEVVDPVELPGADEISRHEYPALLHEFKRDLNAYLSGLPGEHPASLAELIAYNERHADRVLAHFGQEIFERAEAASGYPADPEYVRARAEAARRAAGALDGPLAAHRLDAIVTLTANPAWLTDYHLGDHDVFHTSGPAAVAGYPTVCVPAGAVSGLPVGLSFIGPAWSEPRLIGLASAFERLAGPPPAASLQPACPPPTAGGVAAGRR
jgi:amidase